jgi:hypothetical protein
VWFFHPHVHQFDNAVHFRLPLLGTERGRIQRHTTSCTTYVSCAVVVEGSTTRSSLWGSVPALRLARGRRAGFDILCLAAANSTLAVNRVGLLTRKGELFFRESTFPTKGPKFSAVQRPVCVQRRAHQMRLRLRKRRRRFGGITDCKYGAQSGSPGRCRTRLPRGRQNSGSHSSAT